MQTIYLQTIVCKTIYEEIEVSMSGITKNLGIAIADADAGRITKKHLLEIFQDAIDNGDILLQDNEFVGVTIMPLIDKGVLHRSSFVDEFEKRMNQKAKAYADLFRRKN